LAASLGAFVACGLSRGFGRFAIGAEDCWDDSGERLTSLSIGLNSWMFA